MNIIKLEENFILYNIPAEEKNKLGQNICALVEGDSAFLIDAGYKKQSLEVIDNLAHQGIRVVKVLPTHFHPDHVEGIFLMDKPVIYGNEYAAKTLEQFYDKEDISVMSPTKVISSEDTIEFGDFNISFEHAPGHSDCSMLININDTYLHIGDLYLKTDEGRDVLPFVKWAGVESHIASLKKILCFKDRKFLISHGNCPLHTNEVKEGIDNRIKYLKALIDSENRISAEDAVKECSKPFEFLHWRTQVK